MKALETVTQSGDLRSAYALWVEEQREQYYDELAATRFILWHVVSRGGEYRNPIINEHIYSIITEPKYPYLTRLESYIAEINDKLVLNAHNQDEISRLHRWYYTVAIFKYGLSYLLCEAEIDALTRIQSQYSDDNIFLSIMDEIIIDNNTYAKTAFDLRHRADTISFLSWRAQINLLQDAPWMPCRSSAKIIDHVGNETANDPRLIAGGSNRFCGINLIGFASAILGIGEDLHSLTDIVRYIGANVALVDVKLSDQHSTSQSTRNDIFRHHDAIFPINLFCMPLFETERFRLRTGSNGMRGRYNIGNWPWELATLPKYWHHAFDYMDEIWAISPFLQDAYSQITTKPVYYIPPYVRVDGVDRVDRRELGLTDSNFVFLSLCDFNSHSVRKNPIGTVQAFQRAFPSRRSRERLVVKTLNGHSKPDELNELIRHVADDPRIIVIDGPFSREKTLGLIAAADCYVSLHRSEGFGRVLAEAMLLKTPVIATAYSGSNVLLDSATGFPVDYDLRPTLPNVYPFAEGGVWAEPKLDDAVDRFRFLTQNTTEVSARVAEAFERVSQNHSLRTVANIIGSRLSEIITD